jgi:hypothetical protein
MPNAQIKVSSGKFRHVRHFRSSVELAEKSSTVGQNG